MIEKSQSLWKCKACGKTMNTKQSIKRHSETHIEGMSHACHICSKTYSNRPSLSVHIDNMHSELLSCQYCGKIGMHKNAFRDHKRKCNTAKTLNDDNSI